ncbi:hypothetical protein EDD21DRAFT_156025 [Dissophora ornata]|nr:hypothetical protein EDD21DRAFT_156025 [Dissophora ornata]
MQGDLMRKRKWVEDSDEEGRPYDELWNRDPLSSDSSDEDFTAGSPASLDDDDLTGDEQDLTGEIPCPTVIDQFNGPGTISSQLSGDLSGRIYIGNIDISTIIMNHRRANVIKRKATNIDDYLLANFVVTPTLLTSVISAQFSTETIKEVFPDHNQSVLEPTEGDFVRRLCSKSGHAYPTVQTWFDNEPRIPASIVYRSVLGFMVCNLMHSFYIGRVTFSVLETQLTWILLCSFRITRSPSTSMPSSSESSRRPSRLRRTWMMTTRS